MTCGREFGISRLFNNGWIPSIKINTRGPYMCCVCFDSGRPIVKLRDQCLIYYSKNTAKIKTSPTSVECAITATFVRLGALVPYFVYFLWRYYSFLPYLAYCYNVNTAIQYRVAYSLSVVKWRNQRNRSANLFVIYLWPLLLDAIRVFHSVHIPCSGPAAATRILL